MFVARFLYSDLCNYKYAHWIGLYLSFHLNWVFGPFVHGRLQNLQKTIEVTFALVITSFTSEAAEFCELFLGPPFLAGQLLTR